MSETTQTVEGFAHGLPDRFIHCRELGHDWRPSTARWVTKQRVYERVLRCRSCRSEKVQVVTQHGHLVSSRMRYAANYLAHKVEGFTGGGARDLFRLEAITRSLEAARSDAR